MNKCKPEIDIKYSNTISKLFSSALFKDLATESLSRINYIQKVYDEAFSSSSTLTIEDFFNVSYNHLKSEYKSEYLYKNELIKQVVLKKHKLIDTSIFTEFPCSISKADLLTVNGTTTVYEIKTELDTLNRLAEQIDSYSKTFARVNIVTYSKNIKKIESLIKNKNVGILTYNPLSNKIETIKESIEDLSNLDSKCMFNVLRMNEYKEIIKTEYGKVPNVLNTEIYSRCYNLFSKLTIEKQHQWIVKQLGNRKINDYQLSFSKRLPTSLKTLAITRPLNIKECDNIEKFLKYTL